MTSFWELTNAEFDMYTSSSAYNNTGIWSNLMWKSATWGDWYGWGAAIQTFYSADPAHHMVFGTSRVDVVRN